VRPLVNPTVVKFLESRYPTPSQYELPAGRVNNCRWVGLMGTRRVGCDGRWTGGLAGWVDGQAL